jgi:hypothetical protein
MHGTFYTGDDRRRFFMYNKLHGLPPKGCRRQLFFDIHSYFLQKKINVVYLRAGVLVTELK